MSQAGHSLQIEHAPRLCYAMQQSAVPWLRAVRVGNASAEPLGAARVVLELPGVLAEPLVLHLAGVPAGGEIVLDRLDPRLDGAALANLLERDRATLRARLLASDAEGRDVELAATTNTLDVLAYNEWPGLALLPALVAAFVSPNHPALVPLLRLVAAELQRTTGSDALDGYQTADPRRALAMVAAVHEVLRAQAITYVSAPPSFEQGGQKVRTPEQVLGDRLATCFDLVLLGAALLEHIGLAPLVVFQEGHAFLGAWLAVGSTPEVELGPAVELRKRCDLGALVVVEATVACVSSSQPFAAAQALARRRLDGEAFTLAIDIGAARSAGVSPLPPRTQTFVAADEAAPATPVSTGRASADEPRRAVGDGVDEGPVPAPLPPPKDRLEHWKQKLLDLSMWNRLLNFAATKKTIPLCAHELAALDDRLQQGGRFRIHARPKVGQAGQDPRDLALAQQRTGQDVLATYLADELRAGRLRADLDADELDTRLVEIFRHARTSLEETGANTLYLAVGFLRWFESPTSTKERRAPLLLLPLAIERLSMQEGFRVVLDDAEPRLNQTLLQLLQRDFGLSVGLGETLPEDDHGVDVGAVLDAFRMAAVAQPRWEVLPLACIGFFSFTKYLMWLDLAARDDLLASPVLQHLVLRPNAAFAQAVAEPPREELDDVDPATVFCPKDADSSQLAAVMAGAAGRTFVLEGPPGTGKSQTITNLIAQALANGKRVLFVAEKRAALEVVQRRLTEVGLGAFCLELHSSKSGAKAVHEQLKRALELGLRREPAEWQRLAGELQAQRDLLNDFVRALHRRREHGDSVFVVLGDLVRLAQAPRIALPELPCRSADAIAHGKRTVAELAAVATALAVPCREPWWGVEQADWTPALSRQVEPLARRTGVAADGVRAAIAPVAEAFGLTARFGDAGPSRAQYEALLELAALFRAPSLPPGALLRTADWRAVAGELAQVVATGERREALWSPLAGRWRDELLAMDLDRLAADFHRSADSFVVMRWLRLRGPHRELQAAARGDQLGSARSVRDDLDRALQVRTEDQKLAAAANARQLLGAAWAFGRADWAAVRAWLQWVERARDLLLAMAPGELQPPADALVAIARQLDALADGGKVLPAQLGALRLADDELLAARLAVREPLQLDEVRAYAESATPGWPTAIAARAQRWLTNLPRLREHCAYAGAAAAARAYAAGPLVDRHATGELATAELEPAFARAFGEAWLDLVHREEPGLARFRGQDHERAIARFAELDRRAIKLAAEVTLARLCAQVPQVRDTNVASSELGLLERELKKQRRHKPVRKLLAEIPGLLRRLAPCVLMSPLSIAQFLGRSSARFDLVVFDEASQIPMWDAVGAIGRGESLVVVGDSRQLPPTTFFQRAERGDDEPADDEIPEDLESVLDECGAAGLPRQHLDWHYRSRHESLIAFSNQHYYQNRLLTFPSPHRAGEPGGGGGVGVRCMRVAGVYDRAGSQQNRIEAEALVADVLTRLRDPRRRQQSLGIVTFSRAQQVLIEDLLDRARREHPEIEPVFAQSHEPVFVKNLENVQGDERDVILFSICYGPDAAGKVYENYGPLNLQGGERRLNVAITRARRELVVFTSIGAEQVANRTNAVGAKHLRTFLDYAQRGALALTAASSADPSGEVESPFEAAVRDALVARGHEVHTQIGCSGYRIDLAVVDPTAPGRYLLGIECDGASYHSAATARDRDRLRGAVLEGLGWRLHRVWSTDFWQDGNGEIERIEVALAAAVRALPVQASEPEAPPPEVPVVAEVPDGPGNPAGPEDRDGLAGPEAPVQTAPEGVAEASPPAAEVPETAVGDALEAKPLAESPAPIVDPDGPRPYTAAVLPAAGAADEFATARAMLRLRTQIGTVLAAEAPLTFDLLARRVADAWDLSRVTERVRERLREALPPDVAQADDVLWPAGLDAAAYRGFRVPRDGEDAPRAAEDLPVVEVKNAMRWLLRQHQALAMDDLAREAARCFGITRLGAVVRAVMARGIDGLVAEGGGVRDGEVVRQP